MVQCRVAFHNRDNPSESVLFCGEASLGSSTGGGWPRGRPTCRSFIRRLRRVVGQDGVESAVASSTAWRRRKCPNRGKSTSSQPWRTPSTWCRPLGGEMRAVAVVLAAETAQNLRKSRLSEHGAIVLADENPWNSKTKNFSIVAASSRRFVGTIFRPVARW